MICILLRKTIGKLYFNLFISLCFRGPTCLACQPSMEIQNVKKYFSIFSNNLGGSFWENNLSKFLFQDIGFKLKFTQFGERIANPLRSLWGVALACFILLPPLEEKKKFISKGVNTVARNVHNINQSMFWSILDFINNFYNATTMLF